MNPRTVRSAIRGAVLGAIAAAGTSPLAACGGCTNTVVVSPLGDAAAPEGATGFESDRALTPSECAQLCQNPGVRQCQIVFVCGSPNCPEGGGPGTAGPLGVACEVPLCFP